MTNTNTTLPQYHKLPEWHEHSATWLAWPHNQDDWPEKHTCITWAFLEIMRCLHKSEQINLLVKTKSQQNIVAKLCQKININLDKINFFVIPTNRAWLRDSGPFFVKQPENNLQKTILNFEFNAWAKYSNFHLDNQVPNEIAHKQSCPIVQPTYNNHPIVLEAGALEVNGKGTLIATEECLIQNKIQARNPHLTKQDLESIFHTYLGITNTIWLNKGLIGDDTHGHIDDLCRFANSHQILISETLNKQDPNYSILKENKQILNESFLENYQKPEIILLPMPEKVVFQNTFLPASYANFYIANKIILVPTFNDPNDRFALDIIAQCFPTKTIIGIHSVDLIWGFGAIHCLSMDEPK
jgi:agmatine deiminase